MPFEIEIRPYDDPDVTRMVAEVQAEYVAMYGGVDAAAVDPAEFAPPDGLFLTGVLDGAAVAMGGWRRLPDGEQAEIKRMYVAPAAPPAGSRAAGARRARAHGRRGRASAGWCSTPGPNSPRRWPCTSAAATRR